MTQPVVQDNGMTVLDPHGTALVVERWEDGHHSMWIRETDGTESRSVELNNTDLHRIITFLRKDQP